MPAPYPSPFRFMISAFSIAVLILYLFLIPGTAAAQKIYNCVSNMRMYELKVGNMVSDTAVFKLVAAYRDSQLHKMEEIITENMVPLSKTQPESTLGNWISDAVRNNVSRQVQKADICLFSYGCIGKAYLAPGPLRRKDFYELVPSEHKMILVPVSGLILQELCDSMAQANGMPVSGLSFIIDRGKAMHVMVGSSPLNEHRVYTILLNDYLLKRYRQTLGKLRYRHTGLYLRNLLIDESLAQQDKGIPVQAVLEKRIAYAD